MTGRNPRQSRVLLVLGLVAVVIGLADRTEAVRADNFWMTEPSLRQSFAGTTITGQYVDGRTFTESYDKAGSLRYAEPTLSRWWSGHWSIVRDRFCTIYEASGTGGCFRVHQVSANCFEFYFDSRTEEEARSSTLRDPTWTARAWRKDQPSTCQERPMV